MDYIWHPPLYSFLKFANSLREDSDKPAVNRILDCGAGGKQPPLALFRKYGYDTNGIDISSERVKQAEDFANENGIRLNIETGDMRSIPFGDAFFDFVYEIYSMCHLTKEDIDWAIEEMARVLKPCGYCFLGFISSETWPMMGQERKPGEFWLGGDDADTGGELHSLFGDEEAETYLSAFDIVRKDRFTHYETERVKDMTREEWEEEYTDEQFKAGYPDRLKRANYSHIFYLLRKPHKE